jgi:hypothetical protein
MQRKLPVSLCSDFYIKECRAIFSTSFASAKKFCSGVPKIADFRHVDMEGEMESCQHEASTL